jgi:hypothetical protein
MTLLPTISWGGGSEADGGVLEGPSTAFGGPPPLQMQERM